MKRKIAGILIIFILCFTISAYAADEIETENTKTDIQQISATPAQLAALNLLKKLGVFADDFDGTAQVTRGEYVNYVMSLASLSDAPTDDCIFSDVPPSHQYAGAISSAYSLNVISGYGDETFCPDDVILFSHALSVMAGFIGFRSNELFLQNQTLSAKRIKIIGELSRDCTLSEEAPLTGYEMAVIIYNALEMPVFQKEVNGEKYFTDEKDTVLSYYMGIKIAEGVVSANEVTAIDSGSETKKYAIRIDGFSYSFNPDLQAHIYFGNAVKVYYKDIDNSSFRSLIAIEESDSQNKLRINAENILDKTTAECVYYDNSYGKEFKACLKKGIPAVLNHRFVVLDTSDILKISDGYIELIDHDGDSRFDIVFVYEIQTYFVSYINKAMGLVKDAYGYDDLDLSGSNGETVSVTKDGLAAEVKRIKRNHVLEVSRSNDGTVVNAAISDNKVKGKIAEIGNDYIVIDDVKYEVLNRVMTALSTLKPGKTTTAYLSSNGRIAGFSENSSDGMSYGYLITAAESKGTLESNEADFLIFTSTGVCQNIRSSRKLVINGTQSTYDGSALSGKKVLEILKSRGQRINSVVKYSLNEDGELNGLTLPENRTADSTGYNDDVFSLDYSFRTSGSNFLYYGSVGVLGNRYFVNDALGMGVPSEQEWEQYYAGTLSLSELEKNFRIFSVSTSWKNDETVYNVDIYNADKNLKADLIVTPNRGSALMTQPEYFAVDSVSKSLDADGEPRVTVSGLFKGQQVKYLVKEDEDVFVNSPELLNLEQGDVIRISLNARNEIVNILKIFTSHPETARGKYVMNAKAFDDFNSGDGASSYDNFGRVTGWNWNVQYRLVHGKCTAISAASMKIHLGARNENAKPLAPRIVVPAEKCNYYVYDEESESMTLGKRSDINPDNPNQTVFIRIKYFVVLDVVIINRENQNNEIYWNGYYDE